MVTISKLVICIRIRVSVHFDIRVHFNAPTKISMKNTFNNNGHFICCLISAALTVKAAIQEERRRMCALYTYLTALPPVGNVGP